MPALCAAQNCTESLKTWQSHWAETRGGKAEFEVRCALKPTEMGMTVWMPYAGKEITEPASSNTCPVLFVPEHARLQESNSGAPHWWSWASACIVECHFLLLCIPLPLTTCVTFRKLLYSPIVNLPTHKIPQHSSMGESYEITHANQKAECLDVKNQSYKTFQELPSL